MRVPLLYKPGILRDGTTFQSEYCTDGQWIRFVDGKIRKMKGQQELTFYNNVENIKYLTAEYANGYQIFYATTTEIWRGLVGDNYNVANPLRILNEEENDIDTTTWRSIKFIKDNTPCIAFLRLNDGADMLNTAAGSLYWKPINDDSALVPSPIQGNDVNSVSGGILYSHPCLYLYGNDGTILRSRTNDPLIFSEGDSGKDNISTEKLIFGASVRSGTNVPTLLFWTANSVIYLTNVADGKEPVEFQKEVITENSSLMSSRSVIQYDSLFFWLGTDRVFSYNGLVENISNNINLEHFFDNIDLNKRQKVFGYKVARYGEIRWAYPEIANAGDPNIGCTRELVYNVRENSWYDNALRRDCVTVYAPNGDILSYGEACTNYPFDAVNSYKRIWKHETGATELRNNVHVNIPSFFTTPYYGFVTFNPAKTESAIEKYIVLDQIEPDFPTNSVRTNADELMISVNYKKYAGTALTSSQPVTFKLANLPLAPNLGKIDFRIQGRFINIKFSCDYPYDVGTVLLSFKEGDAQ